MKKISIKICCFIPLLLIIITPIIWVDPLHVFGRDHGLNAKQFYDQRLIKTNILQYENPDYNAIIIGSSRARYMGNMQIGGYKFFNLGFGGLMLADYPGFMDLAREKAPDSLECVIVALDFFGVSKDRVSRTQWKATDEYLCDSQDIAYLARLMISPNSFKYSIKYLSNYIFNGKDAIKSWAELNIPEPQIKSVQLKYLNKVFSTWEFDKKNISVLKNMKTNFKDSRLIFIVNPVSMDFLQIIHKNDGIPDFLNWLQILAQTLDGYYNFMDITPLTSNPQNWHDMSHAIPDTMKLQLETVLLNETDNPNFTFITSENADSVISCIQNRIEEFDFSQF